VVDATERMCKHEFDMNPPIRVKKRVADPRESPSRESQSMLFGGPDRVAVPTYGVRESVLRAAQYALCTSYDLDFGQPFKDLGGNSISAAIMLARLWEVVGVRLPLSTVMASTTLEDIHLELLRNVTLNDK
jgi:hypothetical protein